MLVAMHRGDYAGLEAYRREHLAAIVDYAYRHCRYYRRLFDEVELDRRGLRDFDRLPLLDKATIQAQIHQVMPDEVCRLDFHVQETGGSTGQPFRFPLSFVAGQIDGVHKRFLYDRFMGYQPGDRIATFASRYLGEDRRAQGIYWTSYPHDLPYPSLAYHTAYLTDENLPAYIGHLLEYRPAILRGCPSLVEQVASSLLDRRVRLPFQVKGVLLSFETPHGWQVERIKRAFGERIVFQYGHAEMCIFAYAVDGSTEYLCSPLFGLVEVLDAEGRQVGEGETGEVVVTGYHNRALPFIRYRTGDLAVYGGERDGVVRLRQVVGRTQEHILTRAGQGYARTVFHSMVFGPGYEALHNLKNWQLVQDAPGELVLRIVKKGGFTLADEERMRRILTGVLDVDLAVQYVESIPLGPGGKYRLVVQNVSPEAALGEGGAP